MAAAATLAAKALRPVRPTVILVTPAAAVTVVFLVGVVLAVALDAPGQGGAVAVLVGLGEPLQPVASVASFARQAGLGGRAEGLACYATGAAPG